MGILSDDDLTKERRHVAKGRDVNWNKSHINLAFQAIEDVFEANRGKLSAAIDKATAPFVFENSTKRRLIASWIKRKAEREGIS